MFGIGAGEFILIVVVGLIVFGPGKLPEFGRSLGRLLKEFRKAQAALSASLNDLDEKSPSAGKNLQTTSANTANAVNDASANDRNQDKSNDFHHERNNIYSVDGGAAKAVSTAAGNAASAAPATAAPAAAAPATTAADLQNMMESNPIRLGKAGNDGIRPMETENEGVRLNKIDKSLLAEEAPNK